jgi:gamma-glutamylcyclotransferase (GGCT)/AIG2-like uncharacterized protein YtfP
MSLSLSLPVFVYGSLMADEVLESLLGRVPATCSASLPGYKRHALRERSYPGALSTPGEELEGKLLLTLTPAERAMLDAFEGEEYESREVAVRVKSSVERAAVYALCVPELALSEPWSYSAWREAHLSAFLVSCRCFAAQYDSREGPTLEKH